MIKNNSNPDKLILTNKEKVISGQRKTFVHDFINSLIKRNEYLEYQIEILENERKDFSSLLAKREESYYDLLKIFSEINQTRTDVDPISLYNDVQR